MNKKTLKIIAATAMSIFTLFSVFSASLAWFEMIKNVDDNANNMPINKRERFSKISYHHFTGVPTDDACTFNPTPYASITYNPETKTFSKPVNGAGQEIDGFDLVMEQYDPMNKHKPVLVVAELTDEVDTNTNSEVQVLAKTDTDDFLGSKNANHQTKYALGPSSPMKIATINNKDYYPLSSVICFRAQAFSLNEYNTWSNNGTSYSVSGLTSNTSDWIHPTDHNFAEADVDADYSIFYQDSTIYNSTSVGDTKVKYVAVIVDYYDLAIEYIYSAYLGNTVLEETYDYVLNFTCDWRWEIG